MASKGVVEKSKGEDKGESESSEGTIAEGLDTAQGSVYVPPEWGGTPRELAYSLEIVKDGIMVQGQDISKKDHYVMGRIPTADIVVQHPSTSRCHAVIQYNGHTGEAFLYDLGSTHGTFLNKERLKSRTYAPLRVGDMFKIGASSRLYVFHGPADMMPQEGMNQYQKLMMRKLMEAEKQRERDKQVAAAQMQSAISGGISWGMGEDAVQEDDDSDDEVNWKLHVVKNKITEKQQKLVDKIRSRELKQSHLKKECERIESKQKIEGSLTQGQAVTLARNEQVMERLIEEIEEFEDLLKDSIRESLSAKEKEATQRSKRKRRENASDDEGSTDEDDFYDRTGHIKKKHGQGNASEELYTPEALYSKRASLQKIKEDIERDLAKHQMKAPNSQETDADDALDSFMLNVEEELGADQMSSMESQLSDIEKQLTDTNKLLSISDPDGLYNPENTKLRQKDTEIDPSIEQSTEESEDDVKDPPKTFPIMKDSELMPPPPPVMRCQSKEEKNSGGSLGVTAMLDNGSARPLIGDNIHGESHSVPEKAGRDQKDDLHNSKAHMEVVADLEILSAATKAKEEVANEECKDWKPPEGQSGDGLTHLNAKFGY